MVDKQVEPNTDFARIEKQFKDWAECLAGATNNEKIDVNSILGVLLSAIREIAVYETYMAICRNNPGSQLATPLFARSFVINYYETQAVRIRKLTENDGSETDPLKRVYSLTRILNEIKELRSTGALNRVGLCRLYGIPVLKEEAEAALESEYSLLSGKSGSFSTQASDAVRLHRMLDCIYDKHGTLKKSLIASMETRLLGDKNEDLKVILNQANKYITHAATAESRQAANVTYQLNTHLIKKVVMGITEVFLLLEHIVRGSGWGTLIAVGWQSYMVNLNETDTKIATDVFDNLEGEVKTWSEFANTSLGFKP